MPTLYEISSAWSVCSSDQGVESARAQHLQNWSRGGGTSGTFIEALAKPIWDFILPPEQEVDAEADYRREQRAFLRLLPDLLRTHPGLFVAIHDGKAVMLNRSDVELARTFFRQYGDVSVYIGFIGDEPPALQVVPLL